MQKQNLPTLRVRLLACAATFSLLCGHALAASVDVTTTNSPYTTPDTISGTDTVIIATGTTFTSAGAGPITWNGSGTPTITNAGTLSNTGTGKPTPTINGTTFSLDGPAVILQSTIASGALSIDNSGSIISSQGPAIVLPVTPAPFTLTNEASGTITGNGGIKVNGTYIRNDEAIAILASGTGLNTINQYGTINGDIVFGGGTNIVNIYNGAFSALNGAIVGGAGTGNTINLDDPNGGIARGGSEDIADGPTQLTQGWDNIQNLNVNEGAWMLVGQGGYTAVTIASGASLTICAPAACDLTANITFQHGGLDASTIANNGVLTSLDDSSEIDYDPSVGGGFQVSGTGSLILDGTGLVYLSPTTTIAQGAVEVKGGTVYAAATLTAAVTVDAGATLWLGSGGLKNVDGIAVDSGTTGDVSGAITDNGTLEFGHANSYTYSGLLSGGGLLVQAGAGTTILSGTSSSFAGSVHVAFGTLESATALKLSGTNSFTVDAGATLTQFNTTTSIVSFTGAPTTGFLSNAGTISGTSGPPLVGASSITGGNITIVNSGTMTSATGVVIGLGGALPAGTSISIDNSGTIGDTGTVSGSATYNGSIHAVTLLPQVIGFGGPADFTLTNSGTIQGDINLGSGANVINLVTGESIVGRVNGTASSNNIVNLSGTGSGIVLGSSETPVEPVLTSTQYFTFYGMDNIQTLNVNSGSWSLVGGGYYSNINIASGAVFNVCGGGVTASCGTGYTQASPGGAPSDGGIGVDSGTFTVVNNGTINRYGNGTDIYFDPANPYIDQWSGTGSLVFIGTGTYYVSPLATYTQGSIEVSGATLIDAGTINAAVTVDAASTLDIGSGGNLLNIDNAAPDDGTTGSINGDIIDNGQVTFARSGNIIYGGAISGTGALTVANGVVILTGISSYTGGTTIVGGAALQIGNGGAGGTLASGAVVDNGALSFNTTGSQIVSGPISGGGSLTLALGTVVLAGANSYTGATAVNGGTLSVTGSIAASSGVSVASGATLAGTGTVGAASVASGGILSPGNDGAGTLSVAGNLTLASGAVTNADITAASSDLINVSGTASLGGTLNASFAAGTYNPTQYTLLTSAGALTGAFSTLNLVNLPNNFAASLGYDSHNVFLKFVSGFTAGQTTTIDTGTVNVTGNQTTAGLSGSGGTIDTSGGNLTVAQSTDTSFAGTIAGSGTITVSGGSDNTLVLTGDSSGFTGTTSITGGTLQIGSSDNPNASLGGTVAVTGGTLQVGDADAPGATLDGSVTVDSGGTLEGHGTITGSVTNAGTTAPGGTIGTLHIGGNYTFASGSILAQEVAANGTADLLKADGTVTIAGNADVQVQPTDPIASYARVTNYTIVTGGAGISGTFSSATSSVAGFTPVLSYTDGAANLALVRNDISLATLASSANQAGVGAAISASPGSALFAAVAPDSDAAVRQSLDALSGEVHATVASALLNDSRFMADAVQSRSRSDDTTGIWGHEDYRWSDFGGDGNAAAADGHLLGFSAGIDTIALPNLRLGAAFGYSKGDLDMAARTSTANVNSTYLGGYADFNAGPVSFAGVVSYAWHNISTWRGLALGGPSLTETADYDGNTMEVFGEVRYHADLGGFSAEPFANISVARLETGAFAESGGTAALDGNSAGRNVIYTTLGTSFGKVYALGSGTLSPHVSLGWEHAADGLVPQEALAFEGGGPGFAVAGAPLSRDAFATQAGFDLGLGRIGISLYYAGRLGGNVTQHSVNASLKMSL